MIYQCSPLCVLRWWVGSPQPHYLRIKIWDWINILGFRFLRDARLCWQIGTCLSSAPWYQSLEGNITCVWSIEARKLKGWKCVHKYLLHLVAANINWKYKRRAAVCLGSSLGFHNVEAGGAWETWLLWSEWRFGLQFIKSYNNQFDHLTDQWPWWRVKRDIRTTYDNDCTRSDHGTHDTNNPWPGTCWHVTTDW